MKKEQKWFSNCKTKDEIKKQYKILAKKYHSDINKDVSDDVFIEIKEEYDFLMKNNIKNKEYTIEDFEELGKEIFDKYSKVVNSDFFKIILDIYNNKTQK